MNSKQLQYAIKLSKTLCFSQAAEQLNITQPALSKQILSLENELGVKLFDRSTSPLSLTSAGEFFIREAKELLYKEDQMLRTMDLFKSGDAGHLTIGITPFRSSYLIPNILKEVRTKYPGIQIVLHEKGSDILRKESTEGKYDFAIVNLPVDDSILDIKPLEPDRLVLAVPTNLSHLLPIEPHARAVDFSVCKELPFVVVRQSQEMRRLFDKLCSASDFHPQIAVEAVSLTTAWAVVCAGVAATILPFQFVKHSQLNKDVTIYEIKDAAYTRQPVVVTKRNQYISNAAAYAIALLTQQSIPSSEQIMPSCYTAPAETE